MSVLLCGVLISAAYSPLCRADEEHLIVRPVSLQKKRKQNPQGAVPMPPGYPLWCPFKQCMAAVDPQGLLLKFQSPSIRLDFTSCLWLLKMSRN